MIKKLNVQNLEVGDLVLVRRKTFTGKHKITDHWENDIYRVVSLREDGIPVLMVRKIHGGVERKLHCNMLFPLNQNIQYEDIQLIDHVNESMESADTGTNVKQESADLAVKEQPVYKDP